MTTGAAHTDRYPRCLDELRSRGQQHLLQWWDELTENQRERLLLEIESIPWDVLDSLVPSHVLSKPSKDTPAGLEPAPVYQRSEEPSPSSRDREAIETGRELLRAGKVSMATVAGGQGTRLGIDGPKGCVPVTPVGDKTLFELFALTVLAARRRYDVLIPWYIMTSPANHDQTVKFFEGHGFFGLRKEDIFFFAQGMLPVFDFHGRILLAEKDRLALSPDGHGGFIAALGRSGAIEDMKTRGIEIISYIQVDNPLAKPFDPLFLGLHALRGSEMSTKVTPKVDDLERMGNVCLQDGKVRVIEYSDFPDQCAHSRNPDGSRRFDAGNLAIHALSVSFVERLTAGSLRLRFRRAEKAVAFVDASGALRKPTTPNAVKLETFIFDALPLAENSLVLEVDRSEEFSPVKNATGADSLDSAKRDHVQRACRWLEAAGVHVPRQPDGTPDVTVAISPLFALDAEDMKGQPLPKLQPGHVYWVE